VKPLEDLPHIFLCLMIKGEKYQLKLERSTQFVLVSVLFEKMDCPVLPRRIFYLSFYFLISVDLRTM
jgi:hypothetical protein